MGAKIGKSWVPGHTKGGLKSLGVLLGTGAGPRFLFVRNGGFTPRSDARRPVFAWPAWYTLRNRHRVTLTQAGRPYVPKVTKMHRLRAWRPAVQQMPAECIAVTPLRVGPWLSSIAKTSKDERIRTPTGALGPKGAKSLECKRARTARAVLLVQPRNRARGYALQRAWRRYAALGGL